MATDNHGRNRRDPIVVCAPDIPLDIPWSLQGLLEWIVKNLRSLIKDPDPAAQPPGVTITKNNLGNNVSWNRALKARGYQAFRNTTSDIATAVLFREFPGNDNTSFF